MKPTEDIEVVVSFDTTGSMYQCLNLVRREVSNFAKTLFADVPNFKMGVVAHGDYCDASDKNSYVIKTHELTDDKTSLVNFIQNCGNTGGGDAPECYELVLHTARNFKWTAGKSKVLILIGDDVPHSAHEAQNKMHLDWRNELKCLLEMGVKVYGVQALNRSHAKSFYNEISQITGGFKLDLDQFGDIVDIIKAVCYQQVGVDQVNDFIDKLQDRRSLSRAMVRNFEILTGKKVAFKSAEISKRYDSTDMRSVPAGRFQVLTVDTNNSIKDFVINNGLKFKIGRGFYEFTKRETISDKKEIVVQDKVTGDMFCGDAVRDILGIPKDSNRISPSETISSNYTIFVQSTSYNRKLIGGTKFLYEMEDF